MSFAMYFPQMKRTAQVDFKARLSAYAKNSPAKDIVLGLQKRRTDFLNALAKNASIRVDQAGGEPTPQAEVMEAGKAYLRLLKGFSAANGEHEEEGTPPKTPNKVVKFVWSNTFSAKLTTSRSDIGFEMASVLMNMALYHMRRAAFLTESNAILERDLSEAVNALKTAAAIFQYLASASLVSPETSSDTDPKVSEMYALLCKAQAQELSIYKAIDVKHDPSLISSIANDTAMKFAETKNGFKSVNAKDLMFYSAVKEKMYQGYAYAYHGNILLKQEKSGAAIKSCQSGSQAALDIERMCRAVGANPRNVQRLTNGEFYHRFERELRVSTDKAKRENDFLYHQKVPEKAVDLPAPREVIQVETFQAPERDDLWGNDPQFAAANRTPDETTGAHKDKDEQSVESKTKKDRKELEDRSCTIQ
eukprot:Clim_evm3s164 gene=Clim_evmTU3s164